MGSGDIDAGDRAVVADGEGELRRRAQSVKNAHGNAVGGHNGGGSVRKGLAVFAAVIADDDALLYSVPAFGADDVREGLRRVHDDMDVHAVETDTHDPAQAGCAELQRSEKAALDLILVVPDGVEFLPLALRESGAVQPVLIFLHIICHVCSSVKRTLASSSREAGTYTSAPSLLMPNRTLSKLPFEGYCLTAGTP